jgi:hypothetical protein
MERRYRNYESATLIELVNKPELNDNDILENNRRSLASRKYFLRDSGEFAA